MTEPSQSSEQSSDNKGPVFGLTFAVVLDFVGIFVLSKIPSLSPEISTLTQLVGGTGLIAGSVTGWAFRKRMKELSIAGVAIGCFVVALLTTVVCFLVQQQVFGLGPTPAVIYVVSGAVLCLALGALLAIGGLSLFDKPPKTPAPPAGA